MSRDHEVLLSGAAGTGKSRACLEKLHAAAMKNSGMRGLIIRKTAASLGSTGLVTFREIVAKEALDAGELRWYGGSKAQAAAFIYGNGSELVVGGLDKASRIMSSEYDMIYVQEATELVEDDWEALTTRLRHGKLSFQQLLADCNPGPPTHWLNKRCISGKTRMIFCKHEDNPMLYDKKTETWTSAGRIYIERLEALTGVRYQRLRWGKWAAAEGLVYEDWNPEIHMRRAMQGPPPEWPIYLVVDFGYTNPFCCQWWTMDPDGRLIMFREIYMTRTLVEDHAKVISAHLQKPHVTDTVIGDQRVHKFHAPPLAIICDHDAEDRATLEKHLGLPTIPAIKTVSDGIQAVQARLKVQGDGRPRIQFCQESLIQVDHALEEAKKPTRTAEEFPDYTWDPKAARAVSGMNAGNTVRETPLKQNDHGMDCVRYMVAFLDVQKKVKLRWL
jgi:phage terminase large subunit